MMEPNRILLLDSIFSKETSSFKNLDNFKELDSSNLTSFVEIGRNMSTSKDSKICNSSST